MNGYYYNFNYAMALSHLDLNNDLIQYLNVTNQLWSKSFDEASLKCLIKYYNYLYLE
jgi:hypothetical protein